MTPNIGANGVLKMADRFEYASPSFVREPEGNGVAERFIRTLKENLLWVRVFDTIEELRVSGGENPRINGAFVPAQGC